MTDLSDPQFRALLSLMMVSDPYPLQRDGERVLKELLNAEAESRNYEDWVEACHDFKVEE